MHISGLVALQSSRLTQTEYMVIANLMSENPCDGDPLLLNQILEKEFGFVVHRVNYVYRKQITNKSRYLLFVLKHNG
jgi:hypothetical protein